MLQRAFFDKLKATLAGGLFFGREMGLVEAGHAVGGAKNMPATCFLGRGRVPQLPDASRSGWGWKQHFPNIAKAPLTGGLIFGREMGLEPTRHNHTHLKRACLPFQHSRKCLSIITAWKVFVNNFFGKSLAIIAALW